MGLSTRTELKIVNIVHGIQIVLAIGVVGIGVYGMFGMSTPAPAAGQPRRSNGSRITLSAAAKSLIVIAYEILTENVKALHKYASLKAFCILNIIEVIFWIATLAFTVVSMTKSCQGLRCTLSGVTCGLAAVLVLLAIPIAYITLHHYLHFRKHGEHPDPQHHSRRKEIVQIDSSDDMYSLNLKNQTEGTRSYAV